MRLNWFASPCDFIAAQCQGVPGVEMPGPGRSDILSQGLAGKVGLATDQHWGPVLGTGGPTAASPGSWT